MELILLLLSVPFFYILGIKQLISWFSRKDKTTPISFEQSRTAYLTTAIHELSQKDQQNKTTKSIIEDYKEELKSITIDNSNTLPNITVKPIEQKQNESVEPKSVMHKDIGEIWSNWYSNNTIDLILYIGAFLIVTAASIFVGFQWETISGVMKTSVLALCAISFFICGLIFHNIPKIKNAGSTFIAIGALLIPICGSAWYNFVIKPEGGDLGFVWFITSVISIIVYISLAFFFKSTFYMYITSIATLSLTLSTVRVFDLQKDFYILASIITSLLLLLASIIAKAQNVNTKKFFSNPLEISSDIILPTSLLFGTITAISQDKLFSFEAVLSLLLATCFYLVSYSYLKHPWRLYTAQILFPVSIILFTHWQNIENSIAFYILSAIGFVYILFSDYFYRQKLREQSDATIIIGIAIQFFAFLSSLSTDLNSFHTAILAIFPGISGLIIVNIRKNISFVILSTCSLAIFLFLFYMNVLQQSSYPEYLSLIYGLLGLGSYVITTIFKNKKEYISPFGLSTTLFFTLSLLFSLGQQGYLLLNSFIIAAILAGAAFTFRQNVFVYGSNLFLFLTLYIFLDYTNTSLNYYPVAFLVLSYLLYVCSLVKENIFHEEYRIAGLIGSILTPVAFWYNQFFNNTVEQFALVSAYGATLLFGIDTFIKKTPNFGYATSVIGMVTFLWQINYIGIEDILVYCTILGVYFMVLAYTRKLKNDIDNRQLLDLLGLLILFSPPTVLSFGDDVVKYTVILGIEGIILLFLGISMSYKLYRYGGIFGIVFAVLPHTYSYILSLPRWLIVGLFGFLFLGIGIFLLLRRKENTN